jgi:hypothetical protein
MYRCDCCPLNASKQTTYKKRARRRTTRKKTANSWSKRTPGSTGIITLDP